MCPDWVFQPRGCFAACSAPAVANLAVILVTVPGVPTTINIMGVDINVCLGSFIINIGSTIKVSGNASVCLCVCVPVLAIR